MTTYSTVSKNRLSWPAPTTTDSPKYLLIGGGFRLLIGGGYRLLIGGGRRTPTAWAAVSKTR